jgi:hypothetical protein
LPNPKNHLNLPITFKNKGTSFEDKENINADNINKKE